MDFATLRELVRSGCISTWPQFASAVRLIFANCHEFNCSAAGLRTCAPLCKMGATVAGVFARLDKEARARDVQRLSVSSDSVHSPARVSMGNSSAPPADMKAAPKTDGSGDAPGAANGGAAVEPPPTAHATAPGIPQDGGTRPREPAAGPASAGTRTPCSAGGAPTPVVETTGERPASVEPRAGRDAPQVLPASQAVLVAPASPGPMVPPPPSSHAPPMVREAPPVTPVTQLQVPQALPSSQAMAQPLSTQGAQLVRPYAVPQVLPPSQQQAMLVPAASQAETVLRGDTVSNEPRPGAAIEPRARATGLGTGGIRTSTLTG